MWGALNVGFLSYLQGSYRRDDGMLWPAPISHFGVLCMDSLWVLSLKHNSVLNLCRLAGKPTLRMSLHISLIDHEKSRGMPWHAPMSYLEFKFIFFVHRFPPGLIPSSTPVDRLRSRHLERSQYHL